MRSIYFSISVLLLTIVLLTETAFAQSELSLSDLNGSNGFVLTGEYQNARTGFSTASGDINGDGIDDMIIGAPYASKDTVSEAGVVYVVYGSNAGFNDSTKVSNLNGSNGFIIYGVANEGRAGWSVAAGDVNGDGFDDVIVGAPNVMPNANSANAGATYIVFGTNSVGTPTIDVDFLNGTNGFVINGKSSGNLVGDVVFSTNLNNDDYEDIVINYHKSGSIAVSDTAAIVIFGNQNLGISSEFMVDSLSGDNGFIIKGLDDVRMEIASFGSGDINGDGTDDLIIGNNVATIGSSLIAGQVYSFWGGATVGSSGTLDLNLVDGSNGVIINGQQNVDAVGSSVTAGDVNGDNFDDIIIGAPGGDTNGKTNSGEAYVLYGKSAAFSSPMGAFSINGDNGFIINGVNTGDAVAQKVLSKDLNGDGNSEIILSSQFVFVGTTDDVGATYVVKGRTNVSNGEKFFNLSELNGANGFVINGRDPQDGSGNAIAIGDIDGDQKPDLIIAAINADPNGSQSGEVYGVLNNFFPRIPIPNEFMLLSPSNNVDTLTSTPEKFVWQASSDGIDTPQQLKYTFELSENVNFTTKLDSIQLTGDTTFTTSETLTVGTYYWRVSVTNSSGITTFGSNSNNEPYQFSISTSVSNEHSVNSEVPEVFKLDQNYPNPFNPSTNISFRLPKSERVSITVFDMLGRKVESILRNEQYSAGIHLVSFEASRLASGVYIYRLEAGAFSQTRKMMLIK